MLRECLALSTCHLSRVMLCVTCHVSRVTSHMSCIFFYYYFLVLQSGEASRLRVCYQRGLPCEVM